MDKKQFIQHLAEIWKYSERTIAIIGKNATVQFNSKDGQKFVATYKLDTELWKEIKPSIIEKAKSIN